MLMFMLYSNVNNKWRNDEDTTDIIIAGAGCCGQWEDRACMYRYTAQVEFRDIKELRA